MNNNNSPPTSLYPLEWFIKSFRKRRRRYKCQFLAVVKWLWFVLHSTIYPLRSNFSSHSSAFTHTTTYERHSLSKSPTLRIRVKINRCERKTSRHREEAHSIRRTSGRQKGRKRKKPGRKINEVKKTMSGKLKRNRKKPNGGCNRTAFTSYFSSTRR